MAERLANYDKYSYDYKTYWHGREYEHESEVIALQKMFQNVQGKRIIDIGGSYGRLLDIYYSHFDTIIIVDYSFQTLKRYHQEITEKYPKVTLVAANAYKLPFKDGTFDGGIMFRTIHHIQNISGLFKELNRIFVNGSTFILEFANKFHIKAVIKWLLKLDFKKFDLSPYQQEHRESAIGSKTETIFLNFSPRYIGLNLEENNFKTVKSQSVSFLRVPYLKRRFSTRTLIFIEKLLQKSPINHLKITPSIIYKSVNIDREQKQLADKSFEDILACPECKGSLSISGESANCTSCQQTFYSKNNIWDFRVP